MKALNRQQRKAAIWKFIILYVITVVLIIVPFIFTWAFSKSQRDLLITYQSTSGDCADCEKALSKKTNDYAKLEADLLKCKTEKKDLDKKVEKNDQGISTNEREVSSSAGSGTAFGKLIGEYEKVTSRMGNFIKIISMASGKNKSQITDANYKKIKDAVDSLSNVRMDLSYLNQDLKELAK